MAKTLSNIMTGPVNLYFKDYSQGYSPITGNAVSTSGWTQLGFQSEDGLNTEYAPEFFDIKVQEQNAVVRKELTGEKFSVKFTLMESDLAQVFYAIAGSTYTAGAVAGTNPNKLSFGDIASLPNRSFMAIGIAPTGEELVLFVPKVMSVGSMGTDYKKGEVRKTPFELECLCDPTRTAGETMAVIWEITSPGTATTTLGTLGLDIDDVTVTVVSTTDFASSGTILIDNEKIAYTGKGGTTFTTCTRASGGTTATNHSPGALVFASS